MTVSLNEPLLGAAREGVTYELGAYWGAARRVVVRLAGETVFACVATPRNPGIWFVTDCVPQHRDPANAAMLVRVCDYLTAEHGATDIVAIHPEFWKDEVVAAGAKQLQRVVPMWLGLDAQILGMHARPLPDGYRIAPLTASVDELAVLDREEDPRAWREALSGYFGPVIPKASLWIVSDDGPRAAIVVTSHRGTPFVAHCASAPDERGKGFGKAVLVESMSALAAAGYPDCELNVNADNWIAHRMYRSIGFIQNRTTLRVNLFDREPLDDA